MPHAKPEAGGRVELLLHLGHVLGRLRVLRTPPGGRGARAAAPAGGGALGRLEDARRGFGGLGGETWNRET